jgi:hypothetical protein
MKYASFAMAVLAMSAAIGCETSTVAPLTPPAIDGVWKGKPTCSDPSSGDHTLTLSAHPGGAVDATIAIFILKGDFVGSTNNSTYPLKGVFGRETYRIEFTLNTDNVPADLAGGVAKGIIMVAAVERDLSAITIVSGQIAEPRCLPIRLTRQ